MAATPYAGDPAAAKLKGATGGVRGWEAAVAVALGAVPLVLLPPAVVGFAIVTAALAAAWPAFSAGRRIGGHTGDILGAVEQAFETGFFVGAAAGWALMSHVP